MKFLKLSLFLFICIVPVVEVIAAGADRLRCEYLVNPLGVDAATPRLSWIITSHEQNEMQTAYQILVASSPKQLKRGVGDLWDTGKVTSDESIQIIYGGKQLVSREDCYWKVRVWDRKGRRGSWSTMAHWQMGLLNPKDWSARWIGAELVPVLPYGPLFIRHATFGGIDVTEKLAGLVKTNQLVLTASRETLGMRLSTNKAKRLSVEYEIDGRREFKSVRENSLLSIPEKQLPVPCFRKGFKLDKPVRRATLYVTALGLYEVHLNGHRVGDELLTPGWTDYRKRVRYQIYDVSHLLVSGNNALAALLSNGWYSGHIGGGANHFFGTTPAFLAQLEVTFTDGQTEKVVTDTSWKTHVSSIVDSDFMLGEDCDARLEIQRWDCSNFDDSQWKLAKERTIKTLSLNGQIMEPAREILELPPKSMVEPKRGHWVFDFGQNMVGVVRLKIRAPEGTKITLRHAEMLNPDGTIYTDNLRSAASTDHYICAGGRAETWQPKFTFHGFRYVELSGLPSRPSYDTVTGIVIGSNTRQTGEFTCSDSRINQLQSNIQWGQRGNYLSIPTDCPQRDERLGWMGDAQVFVCTATYNADVAAFFTKWLVDVDDGQSAEGAFSDVSPSLSIGGGAPGWGDAGVICPWTIYETYGDKHILEQHLQSMTRWVDYLHRHSHDFIRDEKRGNDYGDWLSIGADTPKELIGSAYFGYSTRLLAKSYAALGYTNEAAKYEALFQNIKNAFSSRYIAPDGRIQGNTQAGYVMALKFDLIPDNLRPLVAQHLVDDIKAKNNHLSTGFLGVGYLLPVLTMTGNMDTACRLLLQDTFPSWLFSVKCGATTIWERWDGWTPDKGFQNPSMNSFNHYSLGSCGEFLFGCIGGIRPESPGYKAILIDPVIADGLNWAQTRYDSIRGPIATYWKRTNQRLVFNVSIPPNTTATIFVPAREAADVLVDGQIAVKSGNIHFLRQKNGKTVFQVGAGTYKFLSKL